MTWPYSSSNSSNSWKRWIFIFSSFLQLPSVRQFVCALPCVSLQLRSLRSKELLFLLSGPRQDDDPRWKALLFTLFVALFGIQEHVIRVFEPPFVLVADAGPLGRLVLLEIAGFGGHFEAGLRPHILNLVRQGRQHVGPLPRTLGKLLEKVDGFAKIAI